MMHATADPPILLAYPTGRGNWKVWCSHCAAWHHHGPLPGHRAAHCTVSGSPYRPGGYVLQLAEPEAIS